MVRLLAEFSADGGITRGDCVAGLLELQHRIDDELGRRTFYQFKPEVANYFEQPNPFGDKVEKAFPSAYGVSLTTSSPTQFYERNLREKLASVQADQERIKAIYCDRAGIDPEVAEGFFLGESTINANDAVKSGIAHAIQSVTIPAGSPVLQLVFNRQGGM